MWKLQIDWMNELCYITILAGLDKKQIVKSLTETLN